MKLMKFLTTCMNFVDLKMERLSKFFSFNWFDIAIVVLAGSLLPTQGR